MKKRIDYIDNMRGFTILWVVFYHCFIDSFYFLDIDLIKHPIISKFRMPLFFFLSGIFFRRRSFSEFFSKRFKTLIIPFISFYIISVLFTLIKENLKENILNIDMESSNFFKESAFAIIYLFHIHPPVTPTAINLALWFLPVMFTVQMFHYMIDKLTEKRWIMVSIAIIFCIISVILEKNDVSEWCYLNATVKYYIFYLSGSMTGIKMLKFFENKRYAILVLLFSLFAYFLLFRLRIESEIIMYMIDFATVICFIVFIFTFFRFAENFRIFNLLKFWGQHSLEVLVTHMLIIPVVTGVTARCLQSVLLMDLRDHQWLFVFLVFMICVLLEVPVIWFCNRFLQPLLGKKPLMVWGRG